MWMKIYIVPLHDICSEVLLALAYVMLGVIMNEYISDTSVGKAMHNSWKSHQQQIYAHIWNQPTDSR